VKLTDFAHFSVSGFTTGATELSCDRCGAAEVYGLDGTDVGLTDLVAWAQRHVCPQAASRPPARILAVA
jgi:hypothetical protein